MNVDQVRLYRLSVVIEETSFSRAAARLGLTQPALSASIALFERELGVQLLDRSRHGIIPTAYGTALYERSKAIEAELKRASQDLKEIANAATGYLAIGATSGAAVNLTWLSVQRVLKQRPGVTVELIEDWTAATMLRRLWQREFDWVITPEMQDLRSDGLDCRRLFKTRRVFAVRASHPVLGRHHDMASALLDYPLVAPEQTSSMRRAIEDIFVRMRAPPPRIGAIGNSLALAKEIILNSDHFAVMTDAVVQDDVRNGLIRTIEIPVPTEYWYCILRHPGVSVTRTAALFRVELDAECRARGLTLAPAVNRQGQGLDES